MPETSTIRRARKAKRQGKAPSTQAGEFVREEIHHVREGKHGARSPEQAIAIGLSKARRSGVDVGEPRAGGRSRTKTGKKAASKPASRASLARHARAAAKRRGPADRSRAAKKAAKTRALRKSSGARSSRATRRAS